MTTNDEYFPDDDRPRRRAVARRGFAEGVAESMGGKVTRVDDEVIDDEVIDADEVIDEEPEAPAAPPARRTPSGIRKGWGGARKIIEQNSAFAQRYNPTGDATIIKFLEDAPYASYARHWVDRVGQNGQKSTIPMVCLGSVDKDCPVCNIGDRPQSVSAFNVALLDDDGSVSLKTWDVGVRIFNTLQNFHNDNKIGPLSRRFYIVSTAGKGQQKTTNVAPASPASLREDYELEPPTAEALKAIGLYDDSIIDVPKHSTMVEVAAEMSSADEYDD